MGAVKNSGVFKGVSINGQIAKGLVKNGVVFWKQENLHAHTVKILALATAIGATPPTNIANFDSYVRAMYPIWLEYCDLYAMFFADGNTDFKRINLANPDGVLFDFYGGFTLDSNGFKGNGINAYVDTNFNPSLLVSGQKYQLNDASQFGVVSGIDGISTVLTSIIAGARGIGGDNTFFAFNTASHKINTINELTGGNVDLSGLGLKMINRTSATEVNLINKLNLSARKSSSSPMANYNQYLLRRGLNSSFAYSVTKISSYGMGKSIPFEVSQQIRTIENNYRASLGIPQIA